MSKGSDKPLSPAYAKRLSRPNPHGYSRSELAGKPKVTEFLIKIQEAVRLNPRNNPGVQRAAELKDPTAIEAWTEAYRKSGFKPPNPRTKAVAKAVEATQAAGREKSGLPSHKAKGTVRGLTTKRKGTRSIYVVPDKIYSTGRRKRYKVILIDGQVYENDDGNEARDLQLKKAIHIAEAYDEDYDYEYDIYAEDNG